MINSRVILGKNLKLFRERLGLKQEEFSERIDIGSTAISTIETGKSFTTAETLDKICNHFKIQPGALFELDSHFIITDYTSRCETVNDINILLNNLDDNKLRLAAEYIQMLANKDLEVKYKK